MHPNSILGSDSALKNLWKNPKAHKTVPLFLLVHSMGDKVLRGEHFHLSAAFETVIHVPLGHPETMKRPVGGVPGLCRVG